MSKIYRIHLLKYFVGNKAEKRISKRVFRENKARQIFRKTNITLWYADVRVRMRRWEMFVFGKFGLFCFLQTGLLRFAYLTYYRRFRIKLNHAPVIMIEVLML